MRHEGGIYLAGKMRIEHTLTNTPGFQEGRSTNIGSYGGSSIFPLNSMATTTLAAGADTSGGLFWTGRPSASLEMETVTPTVRACLSTVLYSCGKVPCVAWGLTCYGRLMFIPGYAHRGDYDGRY